MIRKRLENKDIKIIITKYIFNNKEKSFNSDNSEEEDEDEYSFAKEEIRKLIINDIKLVIKILNSYYDNISNIDIKNKLYKYKIIFIHEMKNINSDIIMS